ncbi:MAG: hypothetical protein ACRC5C_05940 [Bacilli bacterium]
MQNKKERKLYISAIEKKIARVRQSMDVFRGKDYMRKLQQIEFLEAELRNAKMDFE